MYQNCLFDQRLQYEYYLLSNFSTNFLVAVFHQSKPARLGTSQNNLLKKRQHWSIVCLTQCSQYFPVEISYMANKYLMNNGLACDKVLITPEKLCWTSAAAEN